jgi:integrase
MDAVSSPHSKRAYALALDQWFVWARQSAPEGFTKASVQRYRAHLEASGLAAATVNLRLSAVRRLAAEAADNGLLAAEAALAIARVKGTPRRGARLGHWLTREQASELLAASAGESLHARRDRALLCLLIGCGLRRAEAAALDVAQVQEREGRWVLADILGKRGRIRTAPMPPWAKVAVDQWTAPAGIAQGKLFRAVQGDRVTGQGITAQTVFLVVERFATAMGVPFRPHDLRRSFAKLAYAGGSPLEQIQLAPGPRVHRDYRTLPRRETEPGRRRLRPAGHRRLRPESPQESGFQQIPKNDKEAQYLPTKPNPFQGVPADSKI